MALGCQLLSGQLVCHFRCQGAELFDRRTTTAYHRQNYFLAQTMSPNTFRRWPLWLAALLALIMALAALYTWLSLSWSYSEGERAGYVQKFSKKGWLCKTWEGELAMVAMPGSLAEKFPFTVRDAAVAAKVEKTMGKRVALVYEEHRGVPSSCFGDTDHFVADVRAVE